MQHNLITKLMSASGASPARRDAELDSGDLSRTQVEIEKQWEVIVLGSEYRKALCKLCRGAP